LFGSNDTDDSDPWKSSPVSAKAPVSETKPKPAAGGLFGDDGGDALFGAKPSASTAATAQLNGTPSTNGTAKPEKKKTGGLFDDDDEGADALFGSK
jgi:hypothetical protein